MRSMVSCLMIVLVAATSAGCGGRKAEPEQVVAVVGQQEISLAELQRAFDETTASGKEYGRDSLSARRFLSDYIGKTLLEQVAADSVPWTPILEDRARTYEEGLMVRKLREDTYGSATRISDDEVRRVYDTAGTRYQFRAIPFQSEIEAQRTLRLLHEGAIFAKVADQMAGTTNGGDQGWQTVLTAPEAIIAALADLAPDGIAGPVRAGQGYFLLQLIAKEPNPDVPPYEQSAQGFKVKLIQERGGVLLADFHTSLLEKYKFQPFTDQILWMTSFLHDQTAGVKRTMTQEELEASESDSTHGIPWTSCPLIGSDRDRVLATMTGDTLTAILILDHLMTKMSFTWPRFDKPDETMALVRELALQRLERAEAWQRGLDKDPDIAWRSKKQKDLIHARQFFMRFVRNQSRPTVDEARRWYESQVAAVPEQRRYIMVLVKDWDTAIRVRDLLIKDADPARVIAATRQIDPAASWLGPEGKAFAVNSPGNPTEQQLLRLPLHGVTDPVPAGNRFAVARVEELLAPKVAPFEQVAEDAINRLGEMRADSLLNQIIGARRQATPVKVNEEVFARLNYAPISTQ